MLNIVGNGMGGRLDVEQNVQDMDPKKMAEMARRYPQDVVGIKIAHFKGPEWVAVERAVSGRHVSKHSNDGGLCRFQAGTPVSAVSGRKATAG
jgi:hypothetical protein